MRKLTMARQSACTAGVVVALAAACSANAPQDSASPVPLEGDMDSKVASGPSEEPNLGGLDARSEGNPLGNTDRVPAGSSDMATELNLSPLVEAGGSKTAISIQYFEERDGSGIRQQGQYSFSEEDTRILILFPVTMNTTLVFGSDAGLSYVASGTDRRANSGSMELQEDGTAKLKIELTDVKLEDEEPFSGTITGKLERSCSYLAAQGGPAVTAEQGLDTRVHVYDKNWESEFCAPIAAELGISSDLE